MDWSSEDYAQTYADSLYVSPEDDYVVVKTKPVQQEPVQRVARAEQGVRSQGGARGLGPSQQAPPNFGADLSFERGFMAGAAASKIRNAETPVLIPVGGRDRYVGPFEQTEYVPTFLGGYHGVQNGIQSSTQEDFRGSVGGDFRGSARGDFRGGARGGAYDMYNMDMIRTFLLIVIVAIMSAILMEMRAVRSCARRRPAACVLGL